MNTVKDRLERIQNLLVLMRAALAAKTTYLESDDIIAALEPVMREVSKEVYWTRQALPQAALEVPALDDDEMEQAARLGT